MNLLRTIAALALSAVFLLSPGEQIQTFSVPGQYVTIQAALDAAKTPHSQGEAVRVEVQPGPYRESIRWQSVSNAALTIEAQNAVISGSDAALWTSLGSGLYSVKWDYNWALSTVPKDWTISVALELRHREMVWVDGKPLTLALSCADLKAGYFCIDIVNKRLQFHSTAEPQSVEIAMRETCAIIQGDNLTIRGLTVQHCASDLDKSGAIITGRNITLEGMVFRQNVSGGLNTSNTTNLTTRNLLFADNGLTGWGGAYNTGLRSQDDSALRNNWRGYQHGETGWWIAGLKHLRSSNVVYTNLSLRDGLTHGGWWDFDHRDITFNNLQSTGNLNAGLYIEASPGAITVNGGRITGNARGAAYSGIFATNSTNVILEGVYVESASRPALFIGGEQCRPVGGTCLPVASGWQIRNSTFVSAHSAMQFAPGYGLDLHLKTVNADWNAYAGRDKPILFPAPYGRIPLSQYVAMLATAQPLAKQEQNSRDTIATLTPSPSIVISATFTPTITRSRTPTASNTPTLISTKTPAPIVPTATGTATPTPDATENPTPPGQHWVIRIEGVLHIWIEAGD